VQPSHSLGPEGGWDPVASVVTQGKWDWLCQAELCYLPDLFVGPVLRGRQGQSW
jgi:hypothetical protein